MSHLEKIHNFLSFEFNEPKTFGIYHFISVAIAIVLTIIVCKKQVNASEKTERKMAFWFWIVLLLFEMYKQFVYLFSTTEGFAIDYAWHGFPFQLCSSPLYVLPFIAFLPSGKLRETLVAYFGTFVLVGGIAVYIYPGSVFVETLGINLHTMVWHGSQIFLGVFFNLRRFASKNPPKLTRYFLSALPVFLGFVAVAIILNETIYNALIARGLNDTLNLFFISPHFDCIFPILDVIQDHTPYIVFLFSYIAFLSVFSYAAIFIESFLVKRLTKRTVPKTE